MEKGGSSGLAGQRAQRSSAGVRNVRESSNDLQVMSNSGGAKLYQVVLESSVEHDDSSGFLPPIGLFGLYLRHGDEFSLGWLRARKLSA